MLGIESNARGTHAGMHRTVTGKYAYRAQHAACHFSRASVSRRIGLAVAADPAQRPSMEEVRDALHEMYSAEVRRSREGHKGCLVRVCYQ